MLGKLYFREVKIVSSIVLGGSCCCVIELWGGWVGAFIDIGYRFQLSRNSGQHMTMSPEVMVVAGSMCIK